MSKFLSELLLRDVGDGEQFELIGPLVYRSELAKRDLYVPAGFRTDFASVPKGLWNLFPKHGLWTKAAVVHDFLYVKNGCTRAEADAIFNEAMSVSGVPDWKRRVMFSAVRLGGGGAWKKRRAADTAKSAPIT